MQIVTSFDNLPSLSSPIGITIGSFDGLHLGHRYLIKELKKRVKSSVVITFSNHPLEVIKPDLKLNFLSTPEEKLERLKELDPTLIISLKFTPELAQMSYRDFIEMIMQKLPFSLLLLGEGSSFGKGREGTREKMMILAAEMGFSLHYMKKLEVEGAPVSSQRIRNEIAQGHFEKAKLLMGH